MLEKYAAGIVKDVEMVNGLNIVPSILEVICRSTGMGFAAVARVTDESWVACSVRDEIAFGLTTGDELLLETTICNEIRQRPQPVVIDHVAVDPAYCNHHTPALYQFQSYISVPIFRRDNSFFGTLCAIDPKPARLNNKETIGMFTLYAELISFHLDASEKLALSETKLREELENAELREQFIAILGHDLRNPIAAMSTSAQMLLQMPIEEPVQNFVKIIKSSAYRASGLVDNILDFARGRLGGGLTLSRKFHPNLRETLNQVISEINTAWPGWKIESYFDFQYPVFCDDIRVSQLFSNLLGNAVTHGEPGTPIIVTAISNAAHFRLQVSNSGIPIPRSTIEKLFQPFFRGQIKPGNQGLGLGLFISSEIALAHGGTLTVSSDETETRFMLEIPAPVVL